MGKNPTPPTAARQDAAGKKGVFANLSQAAAVLYCAATL
jgi:hypothetical protein